MTSGDGHDGQMWKGFGSGGRKRGIKRSGLEDAFAHGGRSRFPSGGGTSCDAKHRMVRGSIRLDGISEEHTKRGEEEMDQLGSRGR